MGGEDILTGPHNSPKPVGGVTLDIKLGLGLD